MKRIISIILTLVMCLSAAALLASCSAGESAYDIAVRHGFKGTEEEWYASLKGDKGDAGEAGDKGATGDKGDKGQTGDAGAKGEAGDKGDKGETGNAGANGENGANGANGSAGREIEFNVTDTELQWRYVGETEWKTLATLDSLRGDKGETGDKGEDGKDGSTPTIGEDGCWWVDGNSTGIVAGTPNEDGVVEVVSCTKLWFENSECAIWVYGGAPSLKIGYELSNGRGGIANISESMLINAPTFSGAGVYRDIQVKFLGMTSEKINLTITNTYELVSTVVAVGDDLALQIKKTNADGSTTNIAVTKDMIVSGAVDTTKAGVYPITVMAPEGIKATVNITVVPSFENVLDKTEGLDNNEFTEEKYEITGVITEIKNATFGNMYITDGTNVLYVYGVYSADGEDRYDAFEKKPGVGDTITLYGVVGMYNDAPQMKNAWMKSFEAHEHKYSKPTCDKLSVCSICGATEGEVLGHNFVDGICDVCGTSENITIADAIALGKTYASGEYTKDKYYMTGVITEISNTKYGNMYVTDGINTILIYGTWNSDGTIKYGDMAVKPGVGDTITVYGVIGNFSGSAQMKDGWFIEFVPHECDWDDATCELPKTCSICGATDGEALGHNYVNDTCTRCGNAKPAGSVAEFEFGANGDATHTDGSQAMTNETSSFTNGGYTLQFTNTASVYPKTYDAKGNSCIKFGTSSGTGKLTFTVPADVNSVIIKIAKYKTNDTKITINGMVYTLTKNSNDGEYDEIVLDASTVKTITIATVSGANRAMLNAIVFSTAVGGDELHVCTNYTDATCKEPAKCTVCGQTSGGVIDHNYVGGECTMCGEAEPANGEKTASVKIGEYASANNWADATKYTSLVMNGGDITVSLTGGSNTGKYYNNGTNWRIYQNENPTITVKAAEGKTIISVKITYSPNNSGTLTYNGGNIASATIVSVNANSVVFKVGNTGSGTKGQVRITAIEVVYSE